jgi:hypothetical protein
MKITLFVAMEWFQSTCMILSFLFSLRLINNNKVVKYMRYFYWYSIVGAGMVLVRWTSAHYAFPEKEVMTQLNTYSILFHFTFLSIFISSIFPNKQNVNFSVPLFIIFFTIILLSLILYSGKNINFGSFAIANLGLIIYCIIYYYLLFHDKPNANLLKEPSFWIISGILLGVSASIPINSLHEYLKIEAHIGEEYHKKIFSIGLFSYGLFHLFLVKAYLCSISPQTT